MVRQSIYNTRQPEHPHSPIRRYKRRPQGSTSQLRYMESCPDTALLYARITSTSTATSITPCISYAVMITVSIAPLCQDTNHCHIRYPTLSPSLAAVSIVTNFQLDSTQFFLIRLNWGFVWLESIVHLFFLFDSTHV